MLRLTKRKKAHLTIVIQCIDTEDYMTHFYKRATVYIGEISTQAKIESLLDDLVSPLRKQFRGKYLEITASIVHTIYLSD
jgi:hypothetical protein